VGQAQAQAAQLKNESQVAAKQGEQAEVSVKVLERGQEFLVRELPGAKAEGLEAKPVGPAESEVANAGRLAGGRRELLFKPNARPVGGKHKGKREQGCGDKAQHQGKGRRNDPQHLEGARFHDVFQLDARHFRSGAVAAQPWAGACRKVCSNFLRNSARIAFSLQCISSTRPLGALWPGFCYLMPSVPQPKETLRP
jgi:hypothetical protein